MYYEDEGTGGANFIVGILIGTVLGAGLALLLTPQSGRKTRKQIREAMEGAGLGSERLESMSEELRAALRSGRRRFRG